MGIKLSLFILPQMQKVCMLSLQMKQFVLVRRRNLSYLKCRIIIAAEITNADAIHPGYFLSENAKSQIL
jgi:biotin carboxylase